MRYLHALFLLLFILMPGVSNSDEMDRANELYRSGDYVDAFKLYLPLAEQEIAEAQDMVGMMYMLGVGTKKNYALGALWLSLAAQRGIDHAEETRETLMFEWRSDIIENLKSMR